MAKKALLEKVDIREAFFRKNPRVARLIPGFVYWYIKKIVHQNEMNDFLKVHGKKTGIEFINAVIEALKAVAVSSVDPIRFVSVAKVASNS